MKYVSDFRNEARVHFLRDRIHQITTKPWKIMEICGGQTHAIARYGLFDMLPKDIELIHGPGCPVCVTPKSVLDASIALSQLPGVVFCTFSDMLRVPGSKGDLNTAKAFGAQLKMIYSPLDAVRIAQENPGLEIVLFAVGFETTAPAHAMAVLQAQKLQLKNFSIITSLVRVPPAIEFLLQSPENVVQGFLAAGHVCTIMGDGAYKPLSEGYRVPIVITGFEPVDLLQGIYHCILQLERGESFVENQYQRIVQANGNRHAQKCIEDVFDIKDTPWRGIGVIPKSGYYLKSDLSPFDALKKFNIKNCEKLEEHSGCISGQILQGIKKPNQCPLFAKECTPERPVGAPMVSSEGACKAYYLYSGSRRETTNKAGAL